MPPSQITAYASCYQVGVARVYLVNTLGNYRAPTRAELDAGVDVTRQVRGIDGWQVVADRIERRDYRRRFTATTPGRRYVDESSLTIYAAQSGADARNTITDGYSGYVVFLDGGDVEGYTMDVYPVRCVARPRQRSDSDPFAILYQFAVTGPPAVDVTVPAHDDPYTWPELFSDYPLTKWVQGSNHGLWTVKWDGDGQVIPVDVPGVGRVLQLESSANPNPDIWGDTASSLVVSTLTNSGNIEITARVRTLAQMRNEADPPRGAPNGWEAVWLGWNYTEPTSGTRRFYYVTLKPVGFELGKVDQSIALPGGQRFLWTDSDPFDFGTWYSVRIRQAGSNIKVWVDGVLRANFTDGPGSTGFPLWGATTGEVVMTDGGIVLYHEDARVQFDDIDVFAPNGVGAGAGSWAFTGAAAGKTIPKGAAAGPLDVYTDVYTDHYASGSVWLFTGAAAGTTPTVGVADGVAVGTWLYAGAAAGAAPGSPPVTATVDAARVDTDTIAA